MWLQACSCLIFGRPPTDYEAGLLLPCVWGCSVGPATSTWLRLDALGLWPRMVRTLPALGPPLACLPYESSKVWLLPDTSSIAVSLCFLPPVSRVGDIAVCSIFSLFWLEIKSGIVVGVKFYITVITGLLILSWDGLGTVNARLHRGEAAGRVTEGQYILQPCDLRLLRVLCPPASCLHSHFGSQALQINL